MGPGRDQTHNLMSDSLPTALWGSVLSFWSPNQYGEEKINYLNALTKLLLLIKVNI